LVLLSGAILVATATACSSPDPRSSFAAAWGAIIGLFGFVCWLIAFYRLAAEGFDRTYTTIELRSYGGIST
jgi:hypothetical protein